MAQKLQLVGRRFGRLTVVQECHPKLGVPGRGAGYSYWRCRCECGRKRVIKNGKLLVEHAKLGLTQHCGCRLPGTHRMSYTGTYKSYQSMKSRCLNPNNPGYDNWGGRGIIICGRWLGENGFVNFLVDLGVRPKGKTLDRIDPNGNYEPGNVRWATPKEQNHNRRCSPAYIARVAANEIEAAECADRGTELPVLI